MSEFYHYIWALLPTALIVIALRGYWRKTFQSGLRDYPTDSLKQGIYCVVLLVVAIAIDRSVFDDIFAALPLDGVDPRIPRWLIYPALLSVAAAIQNIFHKRKLEQERREMVTRQQKFTQRGF